MKNIKLVFISIVGLLSLVFAGVVVRQNLETRRGAAGGGNVDMPSEVEVCLGGSGTVPISVSADQKITGYVFAFGFDGSKVEVENVNGNWSIKDGDLKISDHIFLNPKKNIQINVDLKGKQLGNSTFRLKTADSYMSGENTEEMSISASNDTTVKVVDCDTPVNTNTPTATEVPDGGEEVTISQPGSLRLCTQETGTITVSGNSGLSLSGFQFYFDYDRSRSRIEDVTFDSKWAGNGGWNIQTGQLFVSSLYSAGNPPKSFQINVEIKGTEPGRFNFTIDEGVVAGTTIETQKLDYDYTGGTSVFVQDCADDTPTPTNTRPPSATNTPIPTNTQQPSATDTPIPTATTEPQTGCKPCPDGTYIESKADYDCDGTINMEDFAGWYDDYKLDSDNLYGDFNCDGILSEDDVEQWYSELPKF